MEVLVGSEDVSRCGSALHVRGACKRGESDDITDGVDMGARGLEALVDFEQASRIGGDADSIELKYVGVPGSSIGPKKDIGFDLFATFQVQNDAVFLGLDFGEALVVPDNDS
jgi:hypothetical protein